MMNKYHASSKVLMLIIAVPVLFHCTACAPVKPAMPTQYASQDINIHERLSDTAKSIDRSLRILAAAQETEATNAINTACLMTAKGGMGCRATLDWSGPIEPLLAEVARLTEYRVKVMGNTPPIPIIVSITAQDRAIADIVKDAGLQAGKRAHLVVYPSNKIIELRYAAV